MHRLSFLAGGHTPCPALAQIPVSPALLPLDVSAEASSLDFSHHEMPGPGRKGVQDLVFKSPVPVTRDVILGGPYIKAKVTRGEGPCFFSALSPREPCLHHGSDAHQISCSAATLTLALGAPVQAGAGWGRTPSLAFIQEPIWKSRAAKSSSESELHRVQILALLFGSCMLAGKVSVLSLKYKMGWERSLP